MALYQSLKILRKSLIFSRSNRTISLSATTCLRELIEKKEGNVLTIEGKYVPERKEDLLLKVDSKACPLCAIGLDVKYTDVLILKQFLKPDGTMLPRKITGLCDVQHKRVSILILMAQRAKLLPNRMTEEYNDEITAPERRFNTYYDEDTIKHKYKR